MPARDDLVGALSDDNHAIAMAMILRRLDPMTDMALPIQQLKVLLVICASPPLKAQRLAERIGVGAATMTGLVDRLIERKLVVRVEVAHDRRVRLVEATEAGQQLARSVTSFGHGHLAQIVERLSQDELTALSTGMAAVRRVVEELPDGFSATTRAAIR